VGKTVIFQDDCFLAVIEDPRDSGIRSKVATQVDFGEVRQDLAFPIDLVDDGPRLGAQLNFLRVSGSVGDDEQATRPGACDLRENSACRFRSVENQESDGNIQHGSSRVKPLG
jgi:hypothetical protein